MQIYNLFCFPQNIFKANFDFNTDDATCFEFVQFPTAQLGIILIVQFAIAQIQANIRLVRFPLYDRGLSPSYFFFLEFFDYFPRTHPGIPYKDNQDVVAGYYTVNDF